MLQHFHRNCLEFIWFPYIFFFWGGERCRKETLIRCWLMSHELHPADQISPKLSCGWTSTVSVPEHTSGQQVSAVWGKAHCTQPVMCNKCLKINKKRKKNRRRKWSILYFRIKAWEERRERKNKKGKNCFVFLTEAIILLHDGNKKTIKLTRISDDGITLGSLFWI